MTYPSSIPLPPFVGKNRQVYAVTGRKLPNGKLEIDAKPSPLSLRVNRTYYKTKLTRMETGGSDEDRIVARTLQGLEKVRTQAKQLRNVAIVSAVTVYPFCILGEDLVAALKASPGCHQKGVASNWLPYQLPRVSQAASKSARPLKKEAKIYAWEKGGITPHIRSRSYAAVMTRGLDRLKIYDERASRNCEKQIRRVPSVSEIKQTFKTMAEQYQNLFRELVKNKKNSESTLEMCSAQAEACREISENAETLQIELETLMWEILRSQTKNGHPATEPDELKVHQGVFV